MVPLGLKTWFNDLGITNVVELDWWQHYTLKSVDFYLTPVQHWSARSMGDRSTTLWGGWGVFGADFHWYYAGDTGYSRDFADTRTRFAERQTEALGGGFDLVHGAAACQPHGVGANSSRCRRQTQHRRALGYVCTDRRTTGPAAS